MIEISWAQFEFNAKPRELSFESFNFQLAWHRYRQFGDFEYDYNTPGSEFYLNVSRPIPEFNANPGDCIGWQAKFWLNRRDELNSPLDANNRKELVEGLRKSINRKPNLKKWIICTPGLFSDTRNCKQALLKSLAQVAPNTKIDFWHREIYLAFLHSDSATFAPIFKHYFAIKYLGYEKIAEYTQKRIDILKDRYDADLYTPGGNDERIEASLSIPCSLDRCRESVERLARTIKRINSRPGTPSQWKWFSQDYVDALKNLQTELLATAQCLLTLLKSDLTLELCSIALATLRKDAKSINKLCAKISRLPRKTKPESAKGEDSIEGTACGQLEAARDNLLQDLNSVGENLSRTSEPAMYLFGDAGVGKSNFACALSEKRLEAGLPALLILAADLSSNTDLAKQIVDTLEVDRDMNFSDVLCGLNNLGLLRQEKVLIIIDGLNETAPTASVWRNQIQYVVDAMASYPYLMLVTTCRSSYSKQIFGEESVADIRAATLLEGIEPQKIESAVRKYFNKYEITVIDKGCDLQLFKSPLLLKIFSQVNRAKVLQTIRANDIYQCIREYISTLIDRVATAEGQLNDILRLQVDRAVREFANALWKGRTRGLEYPGEFGKLFDGEPDSRIPWQSTNTYKVQDEGLFIRRTLSGGAERAEFSYDLVGGLCIAEAAFFSGSPDQTVELLNREETKQSLREGEDAHPLREDIIKAIVFLCPGRVGRQIFELSDESAYADIAMSMLDTVLAAAGGREVLLKYVSKLSFKSSPLRHFIDSCIKYTIQHGEYSLVVPLSDVLKSLNPADFDLLWTEAVRKSADIKRYLDQKIFMQHCCAASQEHDRVAILQFVSLITASTDRSLRDNATKALVELGRIHSQTLLSVLEALSEIPDAYIFERLVAAAMGVALTSQSEAVTLKIASTIKELVFTKRRTSHLIVLDYCDVLFRYASANAGFGYDRSTLMSAEGIDPPEMDDDFLQQVDSNEKALWGWGPVQYDFARYTLGHIASHGRSGADEDRWPIRECMGRLIKRIRGLGYEEERFKSIDEEIRGEDYGSRGWRPDKIERYGKKYSWIAYFELYGYCLLKGKVKPENAECLRTSSVDIDPTFPSNPPRFQQIVDCFIPPYNEAVDSWLNSNGAFCLSNSRLITVDDDEWVLLTGRLEQKSGQGCRFVARLDAILARGEVVDLLAAEQDRSIIDDIIPSHYYLFAGEIPWSALLSSNDEEWWHRKFSPDSILPTFEKFSWESYHSKCNDVGSVPFLHHKIASELKLRFASQEMCYFDSSGGQATRLHWEQESRFLYLRRSLLAEYLDKTQLGLVWSEYSARQVMPSEGRGQTKVREHCRHFADDVVLINK